MSHTETYFDGGETTAYYQGVEAERERIIKLFEDIKKESSSAENWLHKVARTAFATAAIALIKGEQK